MNPTLHIASGVRTIGWLLSVLLLPCGMGFAAEKSPRLVAPEGYEIQRFDSSGMAVLKPKGWYFRKTSTNDASVYQITKENPAKGFETALTINLAPSIKAKTGSTATAYIATFFASKRRGGTMVGKDPVTQLGDFNRFAFVVDETINADGKSRIQRVSYTLFADDDRDLLVVLVFGCPRDQWSANEAICHVMSDIVKWSGKPALPSPK